MKQNMSKNTSKEKHPNSSKEYKQLFELIDEIEQNTEKFKKIVKQLRMK